MRGLILGLAVGLAVLLTAGEGRADFLSGQDLNEMCSSDNLYSEGACLGYIEGVYDAGLAIDTDPNKRRWPGLVRACVPDDVSAGQLKEVVKKRLRENPAEWHYEADYIVARAFQEAFPCR